MLCMPKIREEFFALKSCMQDLNRLQIAYNRFAQHLSSCLGKPGVRRAVVRNAAAKPKYVLSPKDTVDECSNVFPLLP